MKLKTINKYVVNDTHRYYAHAWADDGSSLDWYEVNKMTIRNMQVAVKNGEIEPFIIEAVLMEGQPEPSKEEQEFVYKFSGQVMGVDDEPDSWQFGARVKVNKSGFFESDLPGMNDDSALIYELWGINLK